MSTFNDEMGEVIPQGDGGRVSCRVCHLGIAPWQVGAMIVVQKKTGAVVGASCGKPACRKVSSMEELVPPPQPLVAEKLRELKGGTALTPKPRRREAPISARL